MKFTIKPSVNGSSIEVELENAPDIIIKNEFIKWYAFLKDMCDVKEPVQDKEKIRYNKNGEPLPSSRQYELMINFGIKFDNDTTRDQATKLIAESYDKMKAEQKKNNG